MRWFPETCSGRVHGKLAIQPDNGLICGEDVDDASAGLGIELQSLGRVGWVKHRTLLWRGPLNTAALLRNELRWLSALPQHAALRQLAEVLCPGRCPLSADLVTKHLSPRAMFGGAGDDGCRADDPSAAPVCHHRGNLRSSRCYRPEPTGISWATTLTPNLHHVP